MKKEVKIKTFLLKVFLSKIILSIIILSYILSSSLSYASTSKRTALENVTKTTSYYEDNIGWITDKSVLEEGLKYFYKETGVQPYILFVEYSEEFWDEDDTFDEDVACAYLEEIYEETFEDEGHFIFAYFECENDNKNELNRYISILKWL